MAPIVNIPNKNRRRCRDTTIEKDGSEHVTDDDTPNLRSMALPWVVMVIASVIAAAVISYQNKDDSSPFDYSYSTSLDDSSHLERLLSNGIDIDTSSSSEQQHHHVHKPVYEEHHSPLFPLSTSDRVGFSLAVCGLMLAAGGGIGGGGILVPIYILVMGFSPKHGEYFFELEKIIVDIFMLTLIFRYENVLFVYILYCTVLCRYSLVEHYCFWWFHCKHDPQYSEETSPS